MGLGTTFDRLSAVRWTGQTLLESTAPAPTLATSTNKFVSAWQDLLPEAWRGDAVLGAFKVRDPVVLIWPDRGSVISILGAIRHTFVSKRGSNGFLCRSQTVVSRGCFVENENRSIFRSKSTCTFTRISALEFLTSAEPAHKDSARSPRY